MVYQERLLTLPCFNELLQHEFPVERIASGNKAKNIEILENHGGVLCSGDPVAGNPTKNLSQKGGLFIFFEKVDDVRNLRNRFCFSAFRACQGCIPRSQRACND